MEFQYHQIVQTIQSVNQTTTGNAADFGDLTVATSEVVAGANGIRALWAGVGTAIDTILFSTVTTPLTLRH